MDHGLLKINKNNFYFFSAPLMYNVQKHCKSSLGKKLHGIYMFPEGMENKTENNKVCLQLLSAPRQNDKLSKTDYKG